MKRTKNKIPDIINQSTSKEFTQVPNKLLRNPTLTFKAKGILCLLLSNKKGWHSYIQTIQQMTKEGEEAIRSGLAELENAGYLMRIQYRDKITKVRRGSFWAYTDFPGNFDVKQTLEMLDGQGLEAFIRKKENPENPYLENPDMDNPDLENQGLKILNIKRHKYKNSNSFSDPDGSEDEIDEDTLLKHKKPSIQERSQEYIPLASKLAKIIQSNKNIKINQSKIKSWANEIRKIVETDGVNAGRIDSALNWYQNNIGGQYIPIIESGASLRSKFIRLESAIARASNDIPKQKQSKTSPKKLIKESVPEKQVGFWLHTYETAKSVLTTSSNRHLPDLAQNIINMKREIEKAQSRHTGSRASYYQRPAHWIIEDYCFWLSNRSWLKDIKPNVFDLNHKIFQEYYLPFCTEDNEGGNPITGEFNLKGMK